MSVFDYSSNYFQLIFLWSGTVLHVRPLRLKSVMSEVQGHALRARKWGRCGHEALHPQAADMVKACQTRRTLTRKILRLTTDYFNANVMVCFMVLHGFVEFTWPISLPKISVSVSLQGWSTRSQGVAATDPSGESMTDPSVTCLGMSWDGQPFPRKDPLVRCCFWCFFCCPFWKLGRSHVDVFCVRWCF